MSSQSWQDGLTASTGSSSNSGLNILVRNVEKELAKQVSIDAASLIFAMIAQGFTFPDDDRPERFPWEET